MRRALAAAPDRLPEGPVRVGLGPDGGWLQTDAGMGRFDWQDVRHVDQTPSAVVLLFGEELGTVLPLRALPAEMGLDGLMSAVAAWRADGSSQAPPPASAVALPDEVPSPFAPPLSE